MNNDQVGIMKHKTAILVILCLLVIGFIGFGTYEVNKTKGQTAKLTAEVVPKGSILTVNGKSVRGGTYKLEPGTVEVSAEKDGFKTSSQVVTLTENQTRYVGLALTPNSDKTANWYADHPDDQTKAEALSSKSFDSLSQEITTQSPLIGQLPFVGAGDVYRIDYGNGNDKDAVTTPTIFITSPTATGRQEALTWIRYGGFDISDYKVVFKNKAVY